MMTNAVILSFSQRKKPEGSVVRLLLRVDVKRISDTPDYRICQ
jgi:hypothetical protein